MDISKFKKDKKKIFQLRYSIISVFLILLFGFVLNSNEREPNLVDFIVVILSVIWFFKCITKKFEQKKGSNFAVFILSIILWVSVAALAMFVGTETNLIKPPKTFKEMTEKEKEKYLTQKANGVMMDSTIKADRWIKNTLNVPDSYKYKGAKLFRVETNQFVYFINFTCTNAFNVKFSKTATIYSNYNGDILDVKINN